MERLELIAGTTGPISSEGRVCGGNVAPLPDKSISSASKLRQWQVWRSVICAAKTQKFSRISEKSAASAKYLKNPRRRIVLVNDLLQIGFSPALPSSSISASSFDLNNYRPLTALALVHTLEPVNRFSSSRKVTAFVGLEPCEESSADKVRWRGISKAGSRLLRFLLIEAVGVAIKYDDELKRFYLHLLHRRDWRKAKVAVTRKLLVRAWIMLRDQIDYAEFLKRGVAVRSARTGRRP